MIDRESAIRSARDCIERSRFKVGEITSVRCFDATPAHDGLEALSAYWSVKFYRPQPVELDLVPSDVTIIVDATSGEAEIMYQM